MSSITAERHLTLVRPSAPVASPRRAAVRLTRRGRLLLLVLACALALLTLAWGAQSVRAAGESDGSATAYVSVESGDTLWSIARTVAPHSDTRDMIKRIADLNDLHSSTVRAGQLLVVPAA